MQNTSRYFFNAKDGGPGSGPRPSGGSSFKPGAGAKPTTSEEHHSQAQWHESESKKPGVTALAARQHRKNAQHHIRMGGGPTRLW